MNSMVWRDGRPDNSKKIERAKKLASQGFSTSEIARKMDVGFNTVKRWIDPKYRKLWNNTIARANKQNYHKDENWRDRQLAMNRDLQKRKWRLCPQFRAKQTAAVRTHYRNKRNLAQKS